MERFTDIVRSRNLNLNLFIKRIKKILKRIQK